MRQYRIVNGLVIVLLAMATSGCTETTPVEEVSVDASGVSVSGQLPEELNSEWPAWRGPDNNGQVPDQPLLTEWSDSANVKWKADVPGRGHSSPVVVGGRVYLATALEAEQQQQVLAFDCETGQQIWSCIVHKGGFPPARDIHQKSTHANGTVACDGERIFTAFLNGGQIVATAVDLEGNIDWQEEIGGFNSKFGYAPSPIIYRSVVIIAADNRGTGYIAALDRGTGKIAWRIARPAVSSYSSPTVANVGGRDQLLISGCDSVSSYDPATGEKLWSTSCLAEATCGTIVTTSDHILASGGYPERETVCLSATGDELWSHTAALYEPSMVIHDGLLFGVSDGGIALCWDIESGQERWKTRPGGKFSASPIVCNGVVYVSDLSGTTHVFSASGETFKKVATNKLGSDCYASPAVADSALYLRVGIGSGGSRREQLVCLKDPEH